MHYVIDYRKGGGGGGGAGGSGPPKSASVGSGLLSIALRVQINCSGIHDQD